MDANPPNLDELRKHFEAAWCGKESWEFFAREVDRIVKTFPPEKNIDANPPSLDELFKHCEAVLSGKESWESLNRYDSPSKWGFLKTSTPRLDEVFLDPDRFAPYCDEMVKGLTKSDETFKVASITQRKALVLALELMKRRYVNRFDPDPERMLLHELLGKILELSDILRGVWKDFHAAKSRKPSISLVIRSIIKDAIQTICENLAICAVFRIAHRDDEIYLRVAFPTQKTLRILNRFPKRLKRTELIVLREAHRASLFLLTDTPATGVAMPAATLQTAPPDKPLSASLRTGNLRNVIEALERGEKLTASIVNQKFARPLTKLKCDVRTLKIDEINKKKILGLLNGIPSN